MVCRVVGLRNGLISTSSLGYPLLATLRPLPSPGGGRLAFLAAVTLPSINQEEHDHPKRHHAGNHQRNHAAIPATADIAAVSATCAYRAVCSVDECPSMLRTNNKSCPDAW